MFEWTPRRKPKNSKDRRVDDGFVQACVLKLLWWDILFFTVT